MSTRTDRRPRIDQLTKQVSTLGRAALADARWSGDTLGVAILGMILYGYSLAIGRLGLLLEEEDIGDAVLTFLTTDLGAAPKWSSGLVAEARVSAFDKAHHPANFELIGVGHSYYGVDRQTDLLDNIFANIDARRR